MSKILLQIVVVFFLTCSQSFAGEGFQETSFTLPASERAVSQWIEANADKITESTAAEIVKKRDNRAHLRITNDDGRVFDFLVTRERSQAGKFEERLTRVVSGDLSAQATLIEVERAASGCSVHVRMSATVDNIAPQKLAVGLRRKVRAIRATIEGQFTR